MSNGYEIVSLFGVVAQWNDRVTPKSECWW